MAQTAAEHGAGRVRIADTVGIASPASITKLITTLKKKLPNCNIGLHAHNDFGMATANSVASLEAGASSVDVVVLGLGERTGCARLEEVVGFIALARDNTLFNPQYLKPLAKLVSAIADRPISNTRPVIGEGIFTCETGLPHQGLHNNPKSYEPFNPERVQAKRKLLYGAKSGKNALLYRCNQISSAPIDDLNNNVIGRIRCAAKTLKRPLRDEELRQLLIT
jgi:homocitrate synthase NifV